MNAQSRRLAATLSALVAVAVLAATEASPGTAARRSEPHARVRISDFKFKPFKLTVKRGTKVTFANRDSTVHEPARPGSFDTGPIAPGRSKSVRFAKPGTYRYICSIHPFMHGKIVVRR